MAKKDGFSLDHKYLDYFEELKVSDADLGILLRGVFQYSMTGAPPVFDNPVLIVLFAVIKTDLDHPEGIKAEWYHVNTKSGIISENQIIRTSAEYRLWRKRVLKRDGYVCQRCHIKSVQLHAHHIKSFSEYPELRFEVDNGITLCSECHYIEHRRGSKKYVR